MVLICSYKSNHSTLLSDETAVTAGCLCVVSRWFFPVKSCLLTGCYINTTSDLCAWDFSRFLDSLVILTTVDNDIFKVFPQFYIQEYSSKIVPQFVEFFAHFLNPASQRYPFHIQLCYRPIISKELVNQTRWKLNLRKTCFFSVLLSFLAFCCPHPNFFLYMIMMYKNELLLSWNSHFLNRVYKAGVHWAEVVLIKGNVPQPVNLTAGIMKQVQPDTFWIKWINSFDFFQLNKSSGFTQTDMCKRLNMALSPWGFHCRWGLMSSFLHWFFSFPA